MVKYKCLKKKAENLDSSANSPNLKISGNSTLMQIGKQTPPTSQESSFYYQWSALGNIACPLIRLYTPWLHNRYLYTVNSALQVPECNISSQLPSRPRILREPFFSYDGFLQSQELHCLCHTFYSVQIQKCWENSSYHAHKCKFPKESCFTFP